MGLEDGKFEGKWVSIEDKFVVKKNEDENYGESERKTRWWWWWWWCFLVCFLFFIYKDNDMLLHY